MAETSIDELDRFYGVNVRGSLLCLRAVTRVMKNQESRVIQGRNGPRDVGRGVIVNLGSCNSFVATPNIVQYTTAKHAVLGMTRNAGRSKGLMTGSTSCRWNPPPLHKVFDANQVVPNCKHSTTPSTEFES